MSFWKRLFSSSSSPELTKAPRESLLTPAAIQASQPSTPINTASQICEINSEPTKKLTSKVSHPLLQTWLCKNLPVEQEQRLREDMQANCDLSMAPDLVKLLSAKKRSYYNRLIHAAIGLCLNCNIPVLCQLIQREFSREDLTQREIETLLFSKWNGPEIVQLAKRVTLIRENNYLYTFDALRDDGSEESLAIVIEAGRRFPAARLMAIFAAGDFASQQSVPFLLECAQNIPSSKSAEEHEWSYHAVMILAKIKATTAVTGLIDLLNNTPSPTIIYALAEIADPVGLESCLNAAQKLLELKKRVEEWHPHYLTSICNTLRFAEKLNALKTPGVSTLLEKAHAASEKLLQEEREFIARYA